MSYNPNIPQGTDPILKSQAQLKANYNAIATAFANNHVALDSITFPGDHSYLQLLSQAGSPTTSADETALYNKIVGGISSLMFAPNSSQTPIQMTYASALTDGSARQYSFVAGPFIVYAGILKAIASGTVITLTPSSTLVYAGVNRTNLIYKAPGTGTNIYTVFATSLSANTFTVTFQSTIPPQDLDMYYLAIGIP